MRFGVLLPHFGSTAAADLIGSAARQAEAWGLDSVWVRDHLTYVPHGMEDPDQTFFEAFTTLTYAGALTKRIRLGTAAVIPFRPPLALAQLVASTSRLTGRQILLGIGAGFRDLEFAAAGQPSTLAERARQVVPETVDILRRAWRGESFTHEGARYTLPEVRLAPAPAVEPEIWYCGTSPLALRLAIQHCTGWVPGRITLPTLAERLAQAGPRSPASPPFAVVVIPLVSVAESRAEALARIDLPALLAYANGHRWLRKPSGGRFETADDLAGLLLAGTPAEVASQIRQYAGTGVTDVVFDLRARAGDYREQLDVLGQAVLPALAPQGVVP